MSKDCQVRISAKLHKKIKRYSAEVMPRISIQSIVEAAIDRWISDFEKNGFCITAKREDK